MKGKPKGKGGSAMRAQTDQLLFFPAIGPVSCRGATMREIAGVWR